MSKNRQALKRDFEELLIEVLTQDYDLNVRRSGDNFDRRRRDVATLCFDYDCARGSSEAKVVVTIEGVDDFSNVLPVDLRSRESIQRSAEDCEALALYLSDYLMERQEDLFYEMAAGDFEYGQREEDLL